MIKWKILLISVLGLLTLGVSGVMLATSNETAEQQIKTLWKDLSPAQQQQLMEAFKEQQLENMRSMTPAERRDYLQRQAQSKLDASKVVESDTTIESTSSTQKPAAKASAAAPASNNVSIVADSDVAKGDAKPEDVKNLMNWDKLTPEQQKQLLQSTKSKWNSLDAKQKQALVEKKYQQWQALTPEQQTHLREERAKMWQSLKPSEQAAIQKQREAFWNTLTPEQQQEYRKKYNQALDQASGFGDSNPPSAATTTAPTNQTNDAASRLRQRFAQEKN